MVYRTLPVVVRALRLTVFVLASVQYTLCIKTGQIAPDFNSHTFIEPKLIHARHKRAIESTRITSDRLEHVHDITLHFVDDGKDYILDLSLNSDLIPAKYFEKRQHNGTYVVNQPNANEIELCHYNGKVRGLPDSWAAISTCDGIRGMFSDGQSFHYIENISPDSGDKYHVLYKHNDYTSNRNCGFTNSPQATNQNTTKRSKRDTEKAVRGPYNENENSRYIELVLVIDQGEYKAYNSNLPDVHRHAKDIANIINSLYMPLNLFVALVGVVVWTDYNEITVARNGDTTLTNFLHYRREHLVKEHPNDNAQLLTNTQFEQGIVGKGLKGPICTFEYSGGVNSDHSTVVGLVATTIAHEMGHNLGMEHDTDACDCPDERCVMAPSSGSMSPTHWSSCSMEYLAFAFQRGMDYCLRNKPEKLFESPVCGNNFVEPGEQCDCGLKGDCKNPCCNPETCMLFANATCATGKCCDLNTCRPRPGGVECRAAPHECDLPEYCDGESEYCPDNVYKIDGSTCDNTNAYCYQGTCRSHTDQCRLLWGPTGMSSPIQCYLMNNKGTKQGNCGYNRLNKTYSKCEKEDIFCGMLHCVHANEKLEFGLETVALISHSYINMPKGGLIPCRTAIVDLGIDNVDPGLTPDGAKCGDNMMCLNQKCTALSDVRAGNKQCLFNCHGNGVCNSKGNCHCRAGYAPPYCDQPGPGGSDDSGPASSPNTSKGVVTGLYVLTLGTIPLLLAVVLFAYCSKRQRAPINWNKNGRKKLPTDPEVGSKKPNGTVSPSSTPLVNDQSVFRNDFLGNHKGFTIKPLTPPPPKPIITPSLTPVRPAPTAPSLKPVASEKLQIGLPVLDATTSSAVRQMVSVPLKPAPSVPSPAHRPSSVAAVHVDGSGGYPTLRRITSFMKNHKPDEKKAAPPVVKANAKFNKELLKNLEISQPILQNEINVPSEPLPLEADQHKAVVLRAQSLRYSNAAKQRPSIPNFGSMRSSKRPASVVTVRPSAPPPQPPPSSNGEYQVPPNRTCADEGHVENIYSVIDEIALPPAQAEENVYKVPRPLESSLLGEIVSAIQERNQESIYTSKADDGGGDRNQLYENIRRPAKSNFVGTVQHQPSNVVYNRPDLVKNCDDNRYAINRSPDVLDAKPVDKPAIIKPKPVVAAAAKPTTATATVGLKKKLNERPSRVANMQQKFENGNVAKIQNGPKAPTAKFSRTAGNR